MKTARTMRATLSTSHCRVSYICAHRAIDICTHSAIPDLPLAQASLQQTFGHVYECLTSLSDYALSMPPTMEPLRPDAPATRLGETELSRISGLFHSDAPVTIRMRPHLTRTVYACVLAHELMHVSVQFMQFLPVQSGHMRAEPQKIEGLCELAALLCMVQLSRRFPEQYSRRVIADFFSRMRNECDTAEQFAQPGLCSSDGARNAHVYGGGLKGAMVALLERRGATFGEACVAFLSSAHVPTEGLQ